MKGRNMRKTKTIKIDEREITIRELRVKDIRKILESTENDASDMLTQVEDLLPLATDLKLRELEDMAPSELKVLWNAFREVNADFLALTGRLGIGKALENFVRKNLIDAFADLSKEDMPAPGDTDGVFS
jgi:hypothetical protein